MEHLYSKLIGLPVFSTDSLRPLYIVQDIIVDPENGAIVAFYIDRRQNLVITPMDIVAIKHGIWIKDSEDIAEASDILRLEKIVNGFGSLFHKNVETESGKVLGKVVDMTFDIHTLRLNKLYTAKSVLGIVQFDARIIPAKNIIEMTKDKVIVKDDDATEKETEENMVLEEGAGMAT